MKNKGITLLEMIISLGLMGIFSVVIFPTLKVSNDLNREIVKKSLFSKDYIAIVNVIERGIRKSSSFKDEYSGKRYLKDGVGVIEEKRNLIFNIGEDVLSKCSNRGNTLFLEYPRSNGARVENSILVFQFIEKNLVVGLAKIRDGLVRVDIFETLFEGIEGEFKRENGGIVVECEFYKKGFQEKVKGYERINIY